MCNVYYLFLQLPGLRVISGSRMYELEIESDDDGDVSDADELHEQFVVPYSFHNEVAVATHKIYILHMNVSL